MEQAKFIHCRSNLARRVGVTMTRSQLRLQQGLTDMRDSSVPSLPGLRELATTSACTCNPSLGKFARVCRQDIGIHSRQRGCRAAGSSVGEEEDISTCSLHA